MTDQAIDKLAHRILLDAVRQEYGSLLEKRPEHDFSPAFEKKMKKLLRRAKHTAWHRFIQAAACILLAVLLTGCAVLAVSPEAREKYLRAGYGRFLRASISIASIRKMIIIYHRKKWPYRKLSIVQLGFHPAIRQFMNR